MKFKFAWPDKSLPHWLYVILSRRLPGGKKGRSIEQEEETGERQIHLCLCVRLVSFSTFNCDFLSVVYHNFVQPLESSRVVCNHLPNPTGCFYWWPRTHVCCLFINNNPHRVMLSHPFFPLARGYNSVVQLNEIMFDVHTMGAERSQMSWSENYTWICILIYHRGTVVVIQAGECSSFHFSRCSRCASYVPSPVWSKATYHILCNLYFSM